MRWFGDSTRPLRATTVCSKILRSFFAGWLFATSAVASEPLLERAGTRQVCVAGPTQALAHARNGRGQAGMLASRVLPNPTFVAEHQRNAVGAPGNETIIGISVPLGIGGRRSLLQDAAVARRDKAIADAHSALFESALAFREAYVTAVVDGSKVEVLAEQQAALDQLAFTVEKLAREGEAAGYDLVRQQMQGRVHRRLLESARAHAAASVALLEGWIGEAVVLTPVPLAELAGGAAVGIPQTGAAAEIQPLRVQSLIAEARASAFDARAARRRAVPDLELFAGYRTTTVASSTDHGVSLRLSIPLTLFDHGQGEAALADAEQQLAASTALVLIRQNHAAQRAAVVQIVRLEAAVADFAQTSADALSLQAKAARLYAAGEASITELIDAFRTAEEARLGRIELAQQLAMARLALMRASGTFFDAGLDKECGAVTGAGP